MPLPKISYLPGFFIILTPKSFKHFIVDKTSSDSRVFVTFEILLLIAPIKKLLIEIDLSESTIITFLNEEIFF